MRSTGCVPYTAPELVKKTGIPPERAARERTARPPSTIVSSICIGSSRLRSALAGVAAWMTPSNAPRCIGNVRMSPATNENA